VNGRSRFRGSYLLFVVFLFLSLSLPTAEGETKRRKILLDGRVSVSIELALTVEEQAKGLGGRKGLRKGSGMLFLFKGKEPRSFWMKGMHFPIDILWIVDGRIVAIERRVPPPKPGRPLETYVHEADMVLEVPSGFSERHGIQVGSTVKILSR